MRRATSDGLVDLFPPGAGGGILDRYPLLLQRLTNPVGLGEVAALTGRLPVRQLPLHPPRQLGIPVTTTLQGAAPEEVETELTDKIEWAVSTISGIDELRSTFGG